MGAVRGFFVGGFDWNGRVGRGPVLVGLLTLIAIVLVSPVIAGATGGRLTAGQVDSVLSATVLVQLFGTIVRRLHDAGRSGWWLLLAILPYMPILIMLALLSLPRGAGDLRLKPSASRRLGFGLTVLLALFLVSRLFWVEHLVSTAEMAPTLQSGDYVAGSTYFRSPERGEIVFYPAPGGGLAVGRIVGLGGERVSQGPQGLEIDGVPVPAEPDGDYRSERLPGAAPHRVVPFDAARPALVAEVPEEYVLILGDNRPLDAAFASEARLAARIQPEGSVRARVRVVLASSARWGLGLPDWVRGMRWGRIWTWPQ